MPIFVRRFRKISAVASLLAGAIAMPLSAQSPASPVAQLAGEATYADLADLVDSAQLVVRVRVRKQVEVEAARAPGLAPGYARLYVAAETVSLLSGSVPVGAAMSYLVDVPRDAAGRPPKLKKQEFVLFARAVPGRAGELQLVDPTAQLAWSGTLEARLRPIMAGLVAADAMPAILGVRDALSVEGNLVGESETQLFLATRGDSPLSMTVVRRPNMAPSWGVSQSEIVDQSARPPAPETIGWYRLACFLPRALPREANLANDAASRRRAEQDYAFILAQLGPCERNRS